MSVTIEDVMARFPGTLVPFGTSAPPVQDEPVHGEPVQGEPAKNEAKEKSEIPVSGNLFDAEKKSK